METIFSDISKFMPMGQAALFTIMLIILKVLMQSRDQLALVMMAQKSMKEEMDKHQIRDDNSFKVVNDSVNDVHGRIDSLGGFPPRASGRTRRD